MKKQILLFTLIAGMGYAILTSSASGPANGSSQNCTGAKGAVTNCSGSAGSCHGGTSAAATASIRVDSTGGVAVTKYVAGMTYTVTVTGTHTSFTNYGFQYAAVSGTGSAQVQAGTFGTTLPASVAKRTLTGLQLIEQSSVISGATLSKQFTWTAPAATAGPVTMYLTVNAVNGDGMDNSADVSANAQKVMPVQVSTAVADVSGNINITTYPNPVSNVLNIQLQDAQIGSYTLNIYDLNGRNVTNAGIEQNSSMQVTAINTANLATGMYVLAIDKDGSRKTVTFVKQ